ncbi:hypothetical protein G7084_00155 [Weissella coleopterorum]|uniref:Uncharacterized protein n=1 Tax=Weissella coleopterorum TaxID=2714949 RepID=A0A6G8AY39_9LACO|nr:hypothetical protein [Weissella coleopterorum]QIL49872.1 hypothetical protein G7084_00155 [Weissella coleopterorum]
MKIDVNTEQNYNVSNMNHGDTWLLEDDVYIIAWVGGVALVNPSPGVNENGADRYKLLINLKDGTPWNDPGPMTKIADVLKRHKAIKIETKVVLA